MLNMGCVILGTVTIFHPPKNSITQEGTDSKLLSKITCLVSAKARPSFLRQTCIRHTLVSGVCNAQGTSTEHSQCAHSGG